MDPRSDTTPSRPLALATISFAVCFAAWGLISASVPYFRDLYGLSATSIGPARRHPGAARFAGAHPDRHARRPLRRAARVPGPHAAVRRGRGGRPVAASYGSLLAVAFLLGLAGSSFAVGVGFVSRWTPPERQGSALGVYGLGNIGQSARGLPRAGRWPRRVGWPSVFRGMAVAAGRCGRLRSALLARDAPAAARPATLGAMLRVLARERARLGCCRSSTSSPSAASSPSPSTCRRCCATSSASRPPTPASAPPASSCWRRCCGPSAAGCRTASAARACSRPSSSASCRSRCCWPGRRWCRSPWARSAARRCWASATAPCSSWCRSTSPRETGTVTGLVGAMGGLGGFFPPLLLGFFRDRLGVVWPGFVLLAADRARCSGGSNRRVFLPRASAAGARRCRPQLRARADRLRAGAWATLWTGAAGGRHRGRFAQPAELRPGAGDLHLRGDLRDLGRRLPLRRLAAEAADARLLERAAGELVRQRGRRCAAWRRLLALAGDAPRRADVHPPALAPALVDAPVPLLGLPARGGDHVPAGLRLDPLRHRCRTTR